MHFTLAAAAGLILASSANAFFRLPCSQPVIDARLDPIVSPGRASSHAHTIMGGSNIGLSSSFDDMRASDCSTCKVKDDKSAYWIPQLYYEWPNKTYTSVDHGGMLVYYLQRGASNETVQAFPDGLRMLAGDPYLRSYTGTLEAQAISWNCINYDHPSPETPNMANTDCPQGLRAQVFFPGCWDGKNLDSSDHKSHMAYPAGMNNGLCPPSHPVHLISIFYEVYYSVDPINKLNAGGRFVLANGDSTGYGLHGDFLNGWDRDVLSRAVSTCTADSGVIEDCGVFQNEGRFYTDDENRACSASNPLPNEKVDGSLPYLPGCVAVTDGPGNASASDLVSGCTAGNGAAVTKPSNATSSVAIPSSSVSPSPSSQSVATTSAYSSTHVQTSSIPIPSPSVIPESSSQGIASTNVPSTSHVDPSSKGVPSSLALPSPSSHSAATTVARSSTHIETSSIAIPSSSVIPEPSSHSAATFVVQSSTHIETSSVAVLPSAPLNPSPSHSVATTIIQPSSHIETGSAVHSSTTPIAAVASTSALPTTSVPAFVESPSAVPPAPHCQNRNSSHHHHPPQYYRRPNHLHHGRGRSQRRGQRRH